MTRRRAWLLRLVLMTASLALAGLVAEAFLRLRFGVPRPNLRPLMMRQANALRGWQMMPHQDHYTYDQHVTLNELGLRGAPLGEKSDGDFRILALGDSMVYGQGVAEADTIPAHLERLLSSAPGVASGAAPRRVRVINSGHRGYATHEELALLEELGERIQPDIVILYWYWNDVFETDIAEMHQWLTRSGPVPFDTSHRLEGWWWWRWHALQIARHSALIVYLNEAVQALRFPYPQPAEIDRAFARLDGYLGRLVALGQARGFRLLVAVVPDHAALDRPNWTLPLGQRVEELAGRHGIPTLALFDAVRAVRQRLGKPPIVPYDGHYLGPANQAMAEATAARLRELSWLPPAAAAGPAH